MIGLLTSNSSQTDRFHSCFISYRAKGNDDKFAHRLHADLQAKGVRSWFAPHDLPIAAKTREAIDQAIRYRDKVLVILSKESIASNWVETEVETAFEEERLRKDTVLFPIRIDDAVMRTRKPWASNLRRTRNIGDFTKWKKRDADQEALTQLLSDLKPQPKPISLRTPKPKPN